MRIKYTYEHQYDIIRKLPLPIQAQKGGGSCRCIYSFHLSALLWRMCLPTSFANGWTEMNNGNQPKGISHLA